MTHWIDGPVDFIGRYESLRDDLAALCHRLGRVVPELGHEYRWGAPRPALSERLLQIVCEEFSGDFDAFGYE